MRILAAGMVEALSDGVFAIVVTLLVLEIKVPHVADHPSTHGLLAPMMGLAPKFVSWVISFLTVCVIWLNHHRLFATIEHLETGPFWLNANLLLWTSFIPFPTALLGDYPANPVAVSLYGLVMGLMATGFVLLRWRLQNRAGLMRAEVDRDAFRRDTLFSVLVGPCAYLTATAIGWLSGVAAFPAYAAIALYFVLPQAHRTRIRRPLS